MAVVGTLAPGRGEIAATPDREGRDPRVERGYMHCGLCGAGRFVKMVHNGIEYGLMQAYAEGFNILRGAASERLPQEQRFEFDLKRLIVARSQEGFGEFIERRHQRLRHVASAIFAPVAQLVRLSFCFHRRS